MKSFLLIGQSNMAGRGFPEEVKPIYNEKIQMLRNGRRRRFTGKAGFPAGFDMISNLPPGGFRKISFTKYRKNKIN